MSGEFILRKGLFALTSFALLCGTIGLSPRAEAAIALDIISVENGTKLGSIDFPAATGSSSQDVELELNAGQVFTQDDITDISWQLDPATSEVLSLSLDAVQGDDPCGPPQAPCTGV